MPAWTPCLSATVREGLHAELTDYGRPDTSSYGVRCYGLRLYGVPRYMWKSKKSRYGANLWSAASPTPCPYVLSCRWIHRSRSRAGKARRRGGIAASRQLRVGVCLSSGLCLHDRCGRGISGLSAQQRRRQLTHKMWTPRASPSPRVFPDAYVLLLRLPARRPDYDLESPDHLLELRWLFYLESGTVERQGR